MKFKDVWSALSPGEKSKLAQLAGTSIGTLRQWAGGYRKTNIKPENAQDLIVGLNVLRTSNAAIPFITLRDLSPACARCAFCPQPTQPGLERNLQLQLQPKHKP